MGPARQLGGLGAHELPWALNVLGVVAGVAVILTVAPVLEVLGAVEVLGLVFGLGLIVWSVWLGLVLLGTNRRQASRTPPGQQT